MTTVKLKLPVGTIFGRLTVLGEGEPHISPNGKRHRKTLCMCECGQVVEVFPHNLRSGDTTSCGCYHSERTRAASTTHGETSNGANSLLYATWASIKQRCTNSNHHAYQWYGGRGIIIYGPWKEDYALFSEYVLTVLGGKPKNHTLDRIDNSKGYVPGNVRWATRKQQARNKTSNRLITFNGKTATLAEWSEITGISYAALQRRLAELNWPIAKALTTTSGAAYFTANGITLTLPEWADKLGIAYKTLHHRVHTSSWPLEKALTTPLRRT